MASKKKSEMSWSKPKVKATKPSPEKVKPKAGSMPAFMRAMPKASSRGK